MAYHSPQDIIDLANSCLASKKYLNDCKMLSDAVLANQDLLIPRLPYKMIFAMLQLAIFHGVMGLMTRLFSLGL